MKKILIVFILFILIKADLLMAVEKNFQEFIVPAGKDLRAIITGDFDHNNISDIALCDYELNCVHILLGQKNWVFIKSSYPVGQNPVAITSGDFNSDGNTDLITANAALNEVVFLYGTGDGKFIVKKDESFYKGKISLLLTCDFNSDGKTDLITGGEGIAVFRGQGDGTFIKEATYEDIQNPVDITMDDFNMDGIADIAIIDNISKNSSTVMPDMPDRKKIQIKEIVIITRGENGRTDRFKGGAGELGHIRSCYFNDDIYPDLVISNPDENQVIVMLNMGQGTFGEKKFIKTGITPEGLNIKDINEDGFTEIITADSGSNTISIIKSSEKQNIINSYKTGNNPDIVVTGDFNGDKIIDIVSLSSGSPFIYMLWGLGGGDFYNGLCGITGESPLSLCKGDFNNDGITDIVTANSLSQDLSILLGTGNGTFYGFPLSTREYPSCVITEDFNNDGNQDLAVVNKLYNGITVYLGKGMGEFADKWSGKTGKRPGDVISGDFNNDGHIDLAVANTRSNSISILTGRGDGTFEKGEVCNTGEEPVKIVTGDFNCDKKEDIACAESASKKVSLFPGKGDGTFLPPLSFPIEGTPVYLLSDYCDKNGFTDLIVADYDSKKLFLFKGDESKFLINTDEVNLHGKPVFLTSCRDGIIAACEENIITFIEKFSRKIDFFTENSPVAVITGNFVSNTGEDMVYLMKDDRYIKLLINENHPGDLQKKNEERKKLIKDSEDLLYKGIYYEKQKNYSSARENYEKSLKLNPESKEIYYRTGLLEEETGNTDKAIKFYLKVLNLTSIKGESELSEETLSELNSHLGYCYYKTGKIEEGKALCRREQDKNPLALFTLGLIYLQKDENALALHTFKKYLNSNFLCDYEKQNAMEAREFIFDLELKSMGSWLPLIEKLESPGNKETIEKLKLYTNYKAINDLIKTYRKIISTDKTITQRSLSALEEILSDNIKEPWKKDGYVTKNDLYYSDNNVYITPLNNRGNSCLYKSEDNGLTWIKLLKTDKTIISLTFIKPDIIIVFTGGTSPSQGSILRTSDGGLTWEKVMETSSHVKKVLLSGDLLYVLTEKSGLFASKNSGINWYLCGFEPEPAGKQIPSVPQNSILVNKIKNWADNLKEEGKINIEKIFENRAGKFFVLLSKNDYNLNKELITYNYIIKSDDSCNTWESIEFPQRENYTDLYFSYKIDNKNIFRYRSKGKGLKIFSMNEKGELYIKYNEDIDLYESPNEGKKWQITPSVPGNKIYNIDISNPEIITVTTEGGLFKSTDGGVTWD